MTTVSDIPISMVCYVVACIMFSMVTLITAHSKYKDWLFKNFNQFKKMNKKGTMESKTEANM